MRRLVRVLLAAACGSQVCHGVFLSNTTDGGTATLANAARTLAQPTFLWTDVGSPTLNDRASFLFEYDNADGSATGAIQCDALTWSEISKAPQPVSLAPFGCVVGVDTDSAPITSGTLTVTSALDAKGNGTISLQLDIPQTTFGDIQVEVVALKGSATFGDESCGSGCRGINPVI